MHRLFNLIALVLIACAPSLSHAQLIGSRTNLPHLTVRGATTLLGDVTISGDCTGCGISGTFGYFFSGSLAFGTGVQNCSNPGTGVYACETIDDASNAVICAFSLVDAPNTKGWSIGHAGTLFNNQFIVNIFNGAGVAADADFVFQCNKV